MDDDGFAGLLQIKAAGGLTVVQSPADALFPQILERAIREVKPNLVLPAHEIGLAIPQLVLEQRMTEEHETEKTPLNRYEGTGEPEASDPWLSGRAPSPYSCPECGGVLWEEEDAQPFGFRCRVGHAYNYDALLAGQTDGMEKAIWAGLRALEEKRSLLIRLAEHGRERGLDLAAERFEHAARELEQPARVLQDLLSESSVYELPQREATNGEDA
jgi:two-component system chemotaxis response regulator CheB